MGERIFIRKVKSEQLTYRQPTRKEIDEWRKHQLLTRLKRGRCYSNKELATIFGFRSKSCIITLRKLGYPIRQRKRDEQSTEIEYYWQGWTQEELAEMKNRKKGS